MPHIFRHVLRAGMLRHRPSHRAQPVVKRVPQVAYPLWFHCGQFLGPYWAIVWGSASDDSASSNRKHRSGLVRNHIFARPRSHTRGLGGA